MFIYIYTKEREKKKYCTQRQTTRADRETGCTGKRQHMVLGKRKAGPRPLNLLFGLGLHTSLHKMRGRGRENKWGKPCTAVDHPLSCLLNLE